MRFITWLIRLFDRLSVALVGDEPPITLPVYDRCEHNATMWRMFAVEVLGKWIMVESSPMCLPCTQKYLETYSTLCSECERPIVQGTPVGKQRGWQSYPYRHLASEYCKRGATEQYGIWLSGFVYPATIQDHASKQFLHIRIFNSV